MKFLCGCGKQINDQTDHLPYKGYVIGDEDWFAVLSAIDEGIEDSGPTPADTAAAKMRVMRLLLGVTREVYQCPDCGELRVLDGDGRGYHFRPADEGSPRNLMRGRQGTGG